MSNWTSLQILTQVAGELGLPRPTTITSATDVQSVQLLALANAAGNELLTYYPWEQFASEYVITTVPGTDSYALPNDWAYFTDQTQWDRTNHWPLLGPKSPQEWAFLKGSLVATLPRMRFRIRGGSFLVFPAPASALTLAMEYISNNWVVAATGTPAALISLNDDVVQYDPWLMVKFIKLKFNELKGLPTTSVSADFMRTFNSLTGKDTGAEILSLSPQRTNPFINARSIPDGNWNQ